MYILGGEIVFDFLNILKFFPNLPAMANWSRFCWAKVTQGLSLVELPQIPQLWVNEIKNLSVQLFILGSTTFWIFKTWDEIQVLSLAAEVPS
jgi:hypothetical protein